MTTVNLILTDQAALKVWELIQEEGKPDMKLRAYIEGGGCSGFQYGFTFDEAAREDDNVITKTLGADTSALLSMISVIIALLNHFEESTPTLPTETNQHFLFIVLAIYHMWGEVSSVQLLVDPISYQYLEGAEIDYKEDINGSQFIIRNPNAATTCGCGSSFSV